MKVSDGVKRILTDDGLFFGLLLILVAVTAYGLGRHSVAPVAEIKAQNQVSLVREAAPAPKPEIETVVAGAVAPATTVSSNTELVGSKNGTKYHLPTCPGASQIKEENKVYFASTEAARAAGYTPAANCKGLE